MRVNTVEEEAERTRAANGRAEKPDAFEHGQLLEYIGAEFIVMLRDAVAADTVEMIHGCVQPDGTGNVRRAGLNLCGT